MILAPPRAFDSILFFAALMVLGLFSASVRAASAGEIDREVDRALDAFQKIEGTAAFLETAEGMLVFPKVYKAGVGIGGEYGEGALRTGGKTVDYYSSAAASFGFQLGIQVKSVVILFMKASALQQFKKSENWKVGVDGSVALIDLGARTAVDTTTLDYPMIGFVFDQKGLMYNLTLEGAKFTKLNKR